MRHALVMDGEIIEFRNYAPNVDQSTLAPGKPRMLPVEIESDVVDPVSQIREGPVYEIGAARVVERYIARDRDQVEIAAMRAAKDAAIEAEFARLCDAPITDFLVDGQAYSFHANSEARENITGVLQMYREADLLGVNFPEQRHWTPFGTDDSILMSRSDLAKLGIAIGVRKDLLHLIKKSKQRALKLMTDPADIEAVDPLSGWND